jgi:hypothetical protein
MKRAWSFLSVPGTAIVTGTAIIVTGVAGGIEGGASAAGATGNKRRWY